MQGGDEAKASEAAIWDMEFDSYGSGQFQMDILWSGVDLLKGREIRMQSRSPKE